MAFLEWNEGLSVKSRLLDADHKKLITLINGINDACLNPNNQTTAEDAISQLVNATKAHFVHEETLMRKTAYPQFIPHKIEHDRLMKQLDEFKHRYAAGQIGLSRDAIIFLHTWLCDHIVQVDMTLGVWLAKHTESSQS